MPPKRLQSAGSTRSKRSESCDSAGSRVLIRADHVWLQPLPGVGVKEQIEAIEDALSPQGSLGAAFSSATPIRATRAQKRRPRPISAPARRPQKPLPESLSPAEFAALRAGQEPELDAFTLKRLNNPLRDRGRGGKAGAPPSPAKEGRRQREAAVANKPARIAERVRGLEADVEERDAALTSVRAQLRDAQARPPVNAPPQARRASDGALARSAPAKKQRAARKVKELDLRGVTQEAPPSPQGDPLQLVADPHHHRRVSVDEQAAFMAQQQQEAARPVVNLTRPRSASVATQRTKGSFETTVQGPKRASNRTSNEDLITDYRSRPSTAPRPGSRYAYLKTKGGLASRGRVYQGAHWLKGRHVGALLEGDPRGLKKVLQVNPAQLMFDRAVQDCQLEEQLLTKYEQRCMGTNEKRHVVMLHRTHASNVTHIEAATDHHRDHHCDEYQEYRDVMRREMVSRTTKRTPTPFTVRRAKQRMIVEHEEKNVLVLNECVARATAKTCSHLSSPVEKARKLKRRLHRQNVAGPMAHVMARLRKREARQSHAVYVASSATPFVGAGAEVDGPPPAFDHFARSQTCAPRSKGEALMLAQERRDLAAVCGQDGVSTVMALNPGDTTTFDKRFRKSMERRGLYF